MADPMLVNLMDTGISQLEVHYQLGRSDLGNWLHLSPLNYGSSY